MMMTILTLRLDPGSQFRFEELRRRHFPPERNQVPAHLTLFHQLPGVETTEQALLDAAQAQAVFPVRVTGLRSLGKGVAYVLASDELVSLHGRLARAFAECLTPQDCQPFRPHVVVQNKATPEQARMLLVELTREFESYEVAAEGLDLWEYLGGPWAHRRSFLFHSSERRC